MAEVTNLVERIDAELAALAGRVRQAERDRAQEQKEREERLEQLHATLESMRDIWKPRLETLIQRFGDRVKATPRLTPSTREGLFEFQSKLARIRLKFSASTDRDVRKVILAYDLEIIPVLIRYETHSELEFPIGKVDRQAVARWIDDRIVDFVRNYISLHENQVYLEEFMVEDPVSHVRFPKFAAGATLERDGKTYYFVDEATRRQFEQESLVSV